jgi:hypothetical protein
MKRDADLDLAKFAQWFRLLIQTSAISNESVTIDHISQAIKLIKSFPYSKPGGYPMLEIEWLMITSWNIGMRFSNIGNENSSIFFFEKAVEISKYLPEDIVPDPVSL